MDHIVYNVTVKIDQDVESEWLQWMRDVHIPDVMKTRCFTDSAIYRLNYPRDDDDGSTYAIQYTCTGMDKLQQYHARYASSLQKEHSEKFANKFVAFRTILEKV